MKPTTNQIQGNDEPRIHFLLHKDATMDDTEVQPGYHYASLNMNAKPLNLLPKLEELSLSLSTLLTYVESTSG
jgi:hypothetical protein